MPGREDRAETEPSSCSKSVAGLCLDLSLAHQQELPTSACSMLCNRFPDQHQDHICLQPFPVSQTSEPSKCHPLSPPASGLPLISLHILQSWSSSCHWAHLVCPPSHHPSSLPRRTQLRAMLVTAILLCMYVVMQLMSASLLDSHPKRGQGWVCFIYYCGPDSGPLYKHSYRSPERSLGGLFVTDLDHQHWLNSLQMNACIHACVECVRVYMSTCVHMCVCA